MPQAQRFHWIVLVSILAAGWHDSPVEARGFRVSLLPNGSENSCLNCHFNSGGGGSRNVFGADVGSLVSRGGREAFWSPALAAEDSDVDGFTNGEEVGDPDGDGVPDRTVNISLPGDPGSSPEAALGDCNLDTALDAHDLACVGTIEARDEVLTTLNTLPGDLDGVGGVGFPDFLVLSANFGTDLVAYTDGNIDLSGPIGFPDFLILSSNFGQGGSGALSTVPEPNSGLPGWIALFAILLRRRSKRD